MGLDAQNLMAAPVQCHLTKVQVLEVVHHCVHLGQKVSFPDLDPAAFAILHLDFHFMNRYVVASQLSFLGRRLAQSPSQSKLKGW